MSNMIQTGANGENGPPSSATHPIPPPAVASHGTPADMPGLPHGQPPLSANTIASVQPPLPQPPNADQLFLQQQQTAAKSKCQPTMAQPPLHCGRLGFHVPRRGHQEETDPRKRRIQGGERVKPGHKLDLYKIVFLAMGTVEPDTVSLLQRRAGDIESNPGPGSCKDCGRIFNHQNKPVECSECQSKFCKTAKKGEKTTCCGLTRWKLEKKLEEG